MSFFTMLKKKRGGEKEESLNWGYKSIPLLGDVLDGQEQPIVASEMLH